MVKAYLISLAICLIVSFIGALGIAEKLERAGYKSTEKGGIFEKLSLLLYLFIPIMNIFLTMTILFRADEIYDRIISEYRIKESLNRGN